MSGITGMLVTVLVVALLVLLPVPSLLTRLANRRWLAVLLTGLAALTVSSLLWIRVQPVPQIHDEFSYLLAADTYCHCRVTNPPHPLWQHFETFHVIQQPTYASKYPPAQGLLLALGRLLCGHPGAGICLAMGLLGVSLCWMLQAWFPPRWALLGALLVTAQVGLVGSWAQQAQWSLSYWGGALPAAAGCLLLGSFWRSRRHPGPLHGLGMGLALAALASSRPYEGLMVSLPVAAALLLHLRQLPADERRRWLLRAGGPLGLVLAITAVWIGYCNARITGDPLRMPYSVYSETYQTHPFFIWQQPRTDVQYRHEMMRRFHTLVEEGYGRANDHSLSTRLVEMGRHFKRAWRFYLGPVLSLPLLLLPWAAGSTKIRFALITVLVLLPTVAAEVFFQPHYASPFTGALAILLTVGLRRMALLGRRSRIGGRHLARAVVALVLMAALHVAVTVRPVSNWATHRALLAESLASSGKHLIIVRYAARHHPFHEWVYNDADIDGSAVVWARDMGDERNQELLRYYRQRRAWLLLADEQPPKLLALPPQSGVLSRGAAGAPRKAP